MVSESVSVSNFRPRASIASRSSRKFSMMPLWTMATWPAGVRVGVGLVGRPVGGPARVPDADAGLERQLAHLLVEVG